MLNMIIDIVVGVSTPLILIKLTNLYSQRKCIEGGLSSLQRDRLLQYFKEGQNRGGLNIREKATVEEMYTNYKKLGGNGFIEDIMHDIREMPTLPDAI